MVFVAFTAKTDLIDHYADTLGAQSIYSPERMAIFTPAAIFTDTKAGEGCSASLGAKSQPHIVLLLQVYQCLCPLEL